MRSGRGIPLRRSPKPPALQDWQLFECPHTSKPVSLCSIISLGDFTTLRSAKQPQSAVVQGSPDRSSSYCPHSRRLPGPSFPVLLTQIERPSAADQEDLWSTFGWQSSG